ncbi:MAG: TonB-dependent receptor plug domain-containing protein [Saprospiraceae bacterium]
MARFAIFLLFLLACMDAWTQSDTTLALETVTITASRFRQTPVGYQATTLDSSRLQLTPSLSLADVLQQNTGIFIKSYGLGSLATSAMRGASAQHTAVVWNGFPIQNPMLGQLDLALLPASLLDAVQVQHGGNGALWGSGAVGGVLQLNNNFPFDQGWQIRWNSQIGSFSQLHNDVKISFSNKKLANSTRLLHQTAENDFPYRITPDAPEQRQQHAGFQQIAILQENRFYIKSNQHVNFRLWWSQAEQEIPPTTTQNFSVAEQNNEFLRATLDWQLAHKQWIIQARTGVFYDFFHYRDSLAGVNSPSHSWSAISEAEAQWNLHSQHRVHFGIHHTYATGEAEGYPNGQQQQQAALFAAYQLQKKLFRARLSARQGLADCKWIPFIPSLGVEYDITKWFLIKSNISRNFRLPTLNDLYWQPGGNPTLQSENGWAEELTLQTHWKKEGYAFQYSITGFNRDVQNWILWVPGTTFWSPQNIAEVRSRGIEQRFHFKAQISNLKFELSAGYDWIRSTQERAATEANIKKQLIYVPEHQAFGRIAFHWKKLNLAYQHQYTGAVFTRSDNLAALPAYQLGFLNMRYGYAVQSFTGNIFLQINNLGNAEYRVIERRRMPGRHFQAGVSLQFK